MGKKYNAAVTLPSNEIETTWVEADSFSEGIIKLAMIYGRDGVKSAMLVDQITGESVYFPAEKVHVMLM